MSETILTDGKGVPIPRPEAPNRDAALGEKIKYLRRMHAFQDRVADIANAAFASAFTKAIGEKQ